jgi:hypothetical protein
LSGSNVSAVLLDVQTADGLIHGLEDERPILGEQVTIDVLGLSILLCPIWFVTCMSVAPEAISSEAHTCRNSCAVYLTGPS